MSATGDARRSRGPPSVHTETKQTPTTPQPTQAELYPRRPVRFDAIPEDNVYSMDVYSMHGFGKTHFACAHPPKVLLGDTENKGQTVAKKFRGLVDWKRIETFDDFRQLCYLAIDSPDVHTIIIDSGDDIQDLAAKEWCLENHQKAVFPIVNFRYVYKKIDDLTLQLEKARKWFISTSRMKEEWINDVSTGKFIRDGYKKYPWSLTLGMELQYGIKDSESNWHLLNRRFGVVTKNNFFGTDDDTGITEAKPYLFHVNHDGIVNELLKPWTDEGQPIPYKDRLDICVKQALKEFGK